MIFWLKNRRPNRWRDRREVEPEPIPDQIDYRRLVLEQLTDEQLEAIAAIEQTIARLGTPEGDAAQKRRPKLRSVGAGRFSRCNRFPIDQSLGHRGQRTRDTTHRSSNIFGLPSAAWASALPLRVRFSHSPRRRETAIEAHRRIAVDQDMENDQSRQPACSRAIAPSQLWPRISEREGAPRSMKSRRFSANIFA